MEKKFRITDNIYHKMVADIEDYAIILMDAEGIILNWNKGAEKIKGYKAYEIIGKSFRLFYTKEDQLNNRPEELLNVVRKEGKVVDESWRVRKDGTLFWGNITITALFDDEHSIIGFTKVTRDLTERLLAEQQLRQSNEELKRSEDLYHKMIGEVEDYAIILLDKDGIILNWNKGAEKIKGYKAEEIIGKSFKLFYTKKDQEKKHPEELLEIAVNEGKAVDESWRVRKNGSLFWGNITITTLFDDEHKVMGFSKVTRDLTERKEAENKIMELNRNLEEKVKERTAELEEMNKELNAFSYSISHDLRAPLRGIHGYSKILLEDYGEMLDEEGINTIKVILRNTKGMAELIDDLLEFSRLGRQSLKISEIDMNMLLRVAIDESPRNPAQQVNFNTLNLYPAKGDYTLLKQVWINLISNAVKYSSTKPVSEIEIGCMGGEEDTVYYIKDNGVGFYMEYYHKIFQVFQRLHGQQEFEGTGVGLAIVQKIIYHHGGKIWATAKPNEGATFFFKLQNKNDSLTWMQ